MTKTTKTVATVEAPADAGIEPTDLTPLSIQAPELAKIAIDPQIVAQLRDIWKHLEDIRIQPPTWLADFAEASHRFSENWKQVTNAIGTVMAEHRSLFEDIARAGDECRRIEAAGWLPHYTTPFDKISACGEHPSAIDAVLEAHYRNEWPNVQSAFLERLDRYELGEEAKATFRQVLEGHGHGLYRLTARSLFPEVERVAREELHDGTLRPITSQIELKKLAGHLTPRDTEPHGMYALTLFQKFFDHLYEHTRTPDDLAAIAADPVPNRHASLHGLLSYETARCSMNAIIMVDFIFQVICAVKRYQAEAKLEEGAPG